MRDVSMFADAIRYLTLRTLLGLGYGHFGGSLSIVETLAVLYGGKLRHDPARPAWEGRDYLVLSKGHAAPALYSALAIRGFFPTDRLASLNRNGTKLPSHADRLVPGVDMTTGSMGQGLSVAAGIAYALRATGRGNRVYCIVGDGELNEGQCWEAAQFIAHKGLSNLTVLVDDNKRQLDGWTADISGAANFRAKFEAFGVRAVDVAGHDVDAIGDSIDDAIAREEAATAIVLDTVKGAGVDYVAGHENNHHVRLDDAGRADLEAAVDALGAGLAQRGVLL